MSESGSKIDQLTKQACTQETMFVPFDESENDTEIQHCVDGPLARSQFDLPGGPLLRFQAYRAAWDKCLDRVKEILYILHKPTMDTIIHSVRNAYIDTPEDVVLPSPELVTLVVSSSDRAYLHEVLGRVATALCEEDEPGSHDGAECEETPGAFINCLSESDCQSITALIKALITGFTTSPPGNKSPKKIKASSSLASYDMHLLRAWYQAVQGLYGSAPSLVVLIHDFHAIDPAILSDVFEICSLHVKQLPLVFILGTSEPTHLQSVLPRSTLACLRTEKHVLPWDLKALECIIRETFFSPIFTPDVMLGPVGFELVFDEFVRHNATLDALLSTLQLLHIQHFYNPLSFIVNPVYDATLSDALEMPSEDWRLFFQLLRQHCIPTPVDSNEAEDEQEWLEITPEQVIRAMVSARSAFRMRTTETNVAVSVMDALLRFLRSHRQKASDMTFMKLGLETLRGTLSGKGIRALCDSIKHLKPYETRAFLEEVYHWLQNLPSNARNSTSDLKAKVVFAKRDDASEVDLTVFVDFLENYFKATLIPFDDINCLDVWWTGDTNIPHSLLNPNPHLSIVTALLEPDEYLGWSKSTMTKRRRELSSLPDTCILFRRYVESGRMVNVYDWYDSFTVALEDKDDEDDMEVDESPSKGKGEGKKSLKRRRTEGEDDRRREVQARFMRSMHELEFVGFLKHTGRKADHVVKTVFDVLD